MPTLHENADFLGAPLRACAMLALLAAYGCSRADAPREATAAGSLSARCEDAVARAAAAPPRPSGWTFAPNLAIGDEESHPLGKVMGAAWDARRGVLYVLDGINAQVAVFDSAGRVVGTFGRLGEGPGEFEEMGGSHGVRPVYNQLALVGNSLAVMDFDLLHFFDAQGRFEGRIRTGVGEAGPHGVRQIAAISDSVILFPVTGAMRLDSDDPEVRTGLRLVRASLRGNVVDTAAFASLRNNLFRMPPFSAVPPSDPFVDLYNRTWDAIPAGLLAVASQLEHGLCFVDHTGRVVSAFRVDVPPIAVDGAQRNRVIEARKRVAGPVMPLTGKRWEDHFKAWPRTLPPYSDLALAADSMAWVQRPRGDGSSVVDLYHARTGYVGSLDPPGGRLPLAFSPGCVFVVEEQTANQGSNGNDFYGLRRWCRTS